MNYFGLLAAILLVGESAFADGGAAGDPKASGEEEQQEELMNFSFGTDKVSSFGFFTATKEQTPGSVYIIDVPELRHTSALTIADALELNVPGLFISRNGLGSVIAQRGAITDTNSKTMVMFDGQNLNQRWSYGYSLALDVPLIGDLERIEASQDPGAILYGSGAISGYVNLIPKSGATSKGFHGRLEYGPIDGRALSEASYGFAYDALGGGELFVYAGAIDARGFRPDKLSWNAAAVDFGADRKGEFLPSTKATLNWRQQNFKLKIQWFDASGSQSGETLGATTGIRQTYFAARPEYTIPLATGHELQISASALLQDSGLYDKSTGQYVAHPVNYALSDLEPAPAFLARESNYGGRIVYKTTAIPHNKLAAGLELGVRDFFDGQSWFTKAPTALPSRAAWNEYSIFAEDVAEVGKFNFTGGVRADWVALRGGYFADANLDPKYRLLPVQTLFQLSPRAAIVYAINDDHALKLIYQHGFRTPNARDIEDNVRLTGDNWVPRGCIGCAGDVPPPVPVKPESVDSVEFNETSSWKPLGLQARASLYANVYQNYIVYNAGERNAPDPLTSVGGEVSLTWKSKWDDVISASYAYSQPVAVSDRDLAILELTNTSGTAWRAYPPHQVKLSVTVPLFKRLTLHANGIFYSGLDAWTSTDVKNLLPAQDPTWSEAAHRNPVIAVNAAAQFKVTEVVTLYAVLKNLYNSGTPVAALPVGHPELTAVGTTNRLVWVGVEIALDRPHE